MGYFVRYLVGTGNWTVDVVARCLGDQSHTQTFHHLCGFARNVWTYRPDDGIHEEPLSKAIMKFFCGKWMGSSFGAFLASKFLYVVCGFGFGIGIRSVIRQAIRNNKYDLVLASSGGGNMSGPGRYAARLAGTKCVLDFRDLWESKVYDVTFLRNRREWVRRKIRNFHIARADKIITVQEVYAKLISRFNQNVSVVRNGYDPDIFFPVEPVQSSRFRITYVGSVYDPPLWKILAEGMVQFFGLVKDRNLVALDFWTTKETFQKSIVPYFPESLRGVMHWNEPVPQGEMPKVFAESSILVGLAHNLPGRLEAIQTKIYEYFAVNRPILNVSYQRIGDSERMTEELNAGCVAVSANEVAEFLIAKYSEWKENGVVCGTIPVGAAEKYSRYKLSSELEKILLQVCSESADAGAGINS